MINIYVVYVNGGFLLIIVGFEKKNRWGESV